ncbi:MAG: zinc metalloprotease HtpX [bacterium]|nr:zinc metalloprotease HtpX [bacterium]
MSFTHLDIKEQRTKKTVLLFIVLFLFYFVGFFILTAIFQLVFVIYSIEERETAFQFRFLSIFFWSFIFAISAAVIHWLFSVSDGMTRILTGLKAQELDTSDRYHERMKNIIEELKIATGSTAKNIRGMVLPTVAVNAFAVSDFRGNAVLGVTEGLLARMNRRQLEAVLAHEMAHIVNKDALLVTIACSLFAVYAQILTAVETAADELGDQDRYIFRINNQRGFAPFLIIPVLWLITLGTMLLNTLISRQREYLADATAVELTRDPLSLAEALYKVSTSWRGIGYTDSTLSPIFILPAEDTELESSENWFANLFSTHPPVSKRLEILLNLGKADFSVFQRQVGTGFPIQPEKGEMPSSVSETTWWVRTESNQWQGPFTALQLTSNPFITPESWVSRDKQGQLIRAGTDPVLSDLFRLRLEGKLLSPYQCPKCRQSLTKIDYEGTQVNRCHFCGGTLVEEQNLFRIFAREEKQFSEELKLKAKASTRQWLLSRAVKTMKLSDLVTAAFPAITCPKCKTEMVRMPYTLQYFIVIDRCYSCKLIWFDKEELELLQILVESREK